MSRCSVRRCPPPRGGARIGLVLAVLACAACAAEPSPPPASGAPALGNNLLTNISYDTAMTCGELMTRLKSDNKADGGGAVLWLDGVYAGRSGITVFPTGWALTVAQAVAGMCVVSVNAARPVLEILADVHRQYGGKAPVKIGLVN